MPSSLETRGASEHFCLLPLATPNHQHLPKRSLCSHLYPSFSGCHLKIGILDCLVLIATGVCIQKFNRTVANKESVLDWLSSQSSEQKEQTETSISQSFSERSLFVYFQSCCPRIKFSFSTHILELNDIIPRDQGSLWTSLSFPSNLL